MWPWGHAATGYLSYLIITRRSPRLPLALFLALGIGTQFPDLIDKPLAWTVSLLPTGRTLAHSLLTFTALALLSETLTSPRRRLMTRAFLVGYAAHILGDAIQPLLTGEITKLTWLFWPVFPSPTYETQQSFLAHFRALSIDSFTLLGFTLTAIAGSVWLHRLYISRAP